MASPKSLPRPLSPPPSTSARSSRPQPSSIVVTSPPWAKDEPPSPKASINESHLATESRPSDVASSRSTYASHPGSPSRWWAFTLPRPREQLLDSESSRQERKNFKDRSMSWLPSATLRDGIRKTEKSPELNSRDWNLSIALPARIQQPFTLAHTATPGWDTPWTSRPAAQGPIRARNSSYGLAEQDQDSDSHKTQAHTAWQRRKNKLRKFILKNSYVPLLFRFVNITLTTAALGIAIHIRLQEKRLGIMGAVGSSPTIVIIFAPLTLLHVMAAIYLEYFGRPLGLWRTSAKLAHTLSEVLFICAWSAALSLCFDNFFKSLVPCASWSQISWYNELPRPPSNIPSFEGSTGDQLCDDQLALICLVGLGLLMYCINLIISLFRIFEKVKYHPAASRS